ncbi:hypothetical protein RvY_12620 [Ramazzottius varieornatus]|uniref:Secreted protein n=1 Tax=Ramazzottius varieornatus TaxID=947166 RepID=A0A1D1VK45_RAMVA|nr:hypothetical protein RvY_12620 [Ramazzottius varieornatus]
MSLFTVYVFSSLVAPCVVVSRSEVLQMNSQTAKTMVALAVSSAAFSASRLDLTNATSLSMTKIVKPLFLLRRHVQYLLRTIE